MTSFSITNIFELTHMNIQESQCYTVIEKLSLREKIKTDSVKILTMIKRKCKKNTPKDRLQKIIDIKSQLDYFKS